MITSYLCVLVQLYLDRGREVTVSNVICPSSQRSFLPGLSPTITCPWMKWSQATEKWLIVGIKQQNVVCHMHVLRAQLSSIAYIVRHMPDVHRMMYGVNCCTPYTPYIICRMSYALRWTSYVVHRNHTTHIVHLIMYTVCRIPYFCIWPYAHTCMPQFLRLELFTT